MTLYPCYLMLTCQSICLNSRSCKSQFLYYLPDLQILYISTLLCLKASTYVSTYINAIIYHLSSKKGQCSIPKPCPFTVDLAAKHSPKYYIVLSYFLFLFLKGKKSSKKSRRWRRGRELVGGKKTRRKKEKYFAWLALDLYLVQFERKIFAR